MIKSRVILVTRRENGRQQDLKVSDEKADLMPAVLIGLNMCKMFIDESTKKYQMPQKKAQLQTKLLTRKRSVSIEKKRANFRVSEKLYAVSFAAFDTKKILQTNF